MTLLNKFYENNLELQKKITSLEEQLTSKTVDAGTLFFDQLFLKIFKYYLFYDKFRQFFNRNQRNLFS